jgi:DNA-directed RNA polymerase specialized sigma24 family protein
MSIDRRRMDYQSRKYALLNSPIEVDRHLPRVGKYLAPRTNDRILEIGCGRGFLTREVQRLARLDARQARLVELRYFGGLSIEETAEALEVSPATVKRERATVRAWLERELRTP